MHRTWLRIILLALFILELANVYFIMPLPGSQQINSVSFAYWLNNNITWMRVLLVVSGILLGAQVYKSAPGRSLPKIILPFIIYLLLFLVVKYFMKADTMFYQPKTMVTLPISRNKVSGDKLVIGVSIDGKAKAYPIQFVGYHHQVRDSIGKMQVMITYCTVCRTGRVFNPVVDGKPRDFRLVGMDHFNAMFEDNYSKSWWRQANGEAVAGPLKGKKLLEIPSQQMLLSDWLQEYPNSLVMQPDTLFKEEYSEMANYDKGVGKSKLTKRDSLSWKEKSWVVGLSIGEYSRAYDWNDLISRRLINDSFGPTPIILVLEKDSASFHGWSRRIAGRSLEFSLSDSAELIVDNQTASLWNMGGWCIQGPLKGNQLTRVPAYQEFWHSWRSFHPLTSKYP